MTGRTRAPVQPLGAYMPVPLAKAKDFYYAQLAVNGISAGYTCREIQRLLNLTRFVRLFVCGQVTVKLKTEIRVKVTLSRVST